jgi:hypothetical protein
MLRLLHEIRDAASLECVAYNWSDLRGMTKVDSDQACALAHDLFLCSAAAVLDEAGDARFVEALPEISPTVLVSAEVKKFAEELKHLAFDRFAWRRLIAYTLDHVPLDDISRTAYERFRRPAVRYGSVAPSETEELWTAVSDFVARWTSADVFRVLLGGGQIEAEDLDNFLRDLTERYERSATLLGSHAAWYLYGFWIERASTHHLWPTEPVEFARIRSELGSAVGEYGGVAGGWVDYFLGYNSQNAVTMILESAPELSFPVDALRTEIRRGDKLRWINDDFLDRIGPATYNVKHHPKGKRVESICRELVQTLEAREMSEDDDDGPIVFRSVAGTDIRQTHRYLTGLTTKHFLGEVAELFALPLVLRALSHRFPNGATCIPGTAIRLHNGRRLSKGPDGIIGTLRRESGLLVLRLHALVEVKGYDEGEPELLRQFEERHLRRLRSHKVHLSCSSLTLGGRWLATIEKGVSERGRPRTEVIVDRCEIDDDVKLIAVLPGKLTRKAPLTRIIPIVSPWTEEGLRDLARSFLVAILRESGNKVDLEQDHYLLGQKAWAAATSSLLRDPAMNLTAEDRSSMLQIGQADHIRPDASLLAVRAEV